MATDNTLTLIQAVTVGAGGAATITFNSIPQTYTDLIVKFSLRCDTSNVEMYATFNSDSTNKYTYKIVRGNPAAGGVSSDSQTGATYNKFYINWSSTTANTFGNGEMYIPNYTSANNKSYSSDMVAENNSTDAWSQLNSGIYTSTNAITSITFTANTGNFVQHSTAYLYGVKSVATSAKATGGIITQDDTYFYHTFLSSGTFTPTQSLTADYLVVAGGGGGGAQVGGGGGAGGLRCSVTATGGGGTLPSALSLTATGYAVTVGAGGAGGTTYYEGSNGSTSSFSTVSTTGGGGGGASGGGRRSGANGGSGGGGGNSSGNTAGSGTADEGFAGGAGSGAGMPGGGGGAGAVGTVGQSSNPGFGVAGGIGVATLINTGISTYYAGGGGSGARNDGGTTGSLGGGAGGFGGGGNGGAVGIAGVSGTSNTGGGGGGGGYTDASPYAAGGSGGSGIVIVRYAK